MNTNSNNTQMKPTKTLVWDMDTCENYNLVELNPEEDIAIGERAIITHWSNTLNTYVIIPGASYYIMTANGLVLDE